MSETVLEGHITVLEGHRTYLNSEAIRMYEIARQKDRRISVLIEWLDMCVRSNAKRTTFSGNSAHSFRSGFLFQGIARQGVKLANTGTQDARIVIAIKMDTVALGTIYAWQIVSLNNKRD